MKFYIETERLILRDMQLTDVDGMFALDSDPKVHLYLGNNPIAKKEEAIKSITYIQQQYQEHKIGRWAVIEKASGDFIGWSGLKLNTEEKLNDHINFYDVGYRFIPKYWGKGYATETAIATLQYGFNKMKLKTIIGVADVKNIGSNKVLRKIGLQHVNEFYYKDGTLCNWYEISAAEAIK